MASLQNDALFYLVKSLTKAEKRQFKLFAKAAQGVEDKKFVQLFDVLDKMDDYDEDAIFERAPDIKRQQLSNLKRHLYRRVLASLRSQYIARNIDIEIREQIDYAKILYSKGLYHQSLRLLERVKGIAKDAHQDILHFEIIEFEKLIESRHITRSFDNRAEELVEESRRRNEVVGLSSELSSLGLRLYGLYIKIGHVGNEKDAFMVREFWRANMPKTSERKLTFFEKAYLYQAYVWYHYILQDFLQCYKYARKWVELFERQPAMCRIDPDLYMRGINNLMAILFYVGRSEQLENCLLQLETFQQQYGQEWSSHSEASAFIYIYTAKINRHFMSGTFTDGLSLILHVETGLRHYKRHLDDYRVMVFYYKIACLYFGSGDNGHAIDYLNRIINSSLGQLREDIQCYARLLHLIAHYELGHYDLLEYLVKSVYRFLAKMKELNAVQSEVLHFLRTTIHKNPKALRPDFVRLKARLQSLAADPFERRSFLYLDILSWLESKIEGRSVQDVIREKALRN